MSTGECVFCVRNAADQPPVAEWVIRQELVSAYVLPRAEYPGWFVLQMNRHVPGHQDFTDAEAIAFGRGIRTLATAVGRVMHGTRVFQYSIGEVYAHVHTLIGPPPPGATETGKEILCKIITRDPQYLDKEKSLDIAARVAAEVRALTGSAGSTA